MLLTYLICYFLKKLTEEQEGNLHKISN